MSIVRHHWLSIALSIALLQLFESFVLDLAVIVSSLAYHLYVMRKHAWIPLIILLLFLALAPQESSASFENELLQIDEIRSSYALANDGERQYLITPVSDEWGIGDILRVEASEYEITSYANAHVFRFDEYMANKGIMIGLSIDDYEIVTESNSLKARLYRFIDALEDEEVRTAMRRLFYRIDESDDAYGYLLYASGTHILFLAGAFAWLFHLNKQTCALACVSVAMLLLPIQAYMMRIFIFSLVNHYFAKESKQDKIGLSIVLCLFIDRSLFYETSFILPVFLRLADAFNHTKYPKKAASLFVLFPYQLLAYHECNIALLFVYGGLRILNGMTFIVAIFSLFISPLERIFKILVFGLEKIVELLDSLPVVIGTPSLWWIFIWIALALLLMSEQKKKLLRSFGIVVLIVLQGFQKELTWYGEVTFIDVGQGDCILIREPLWGKTMLIDIAGKMDSNLPESTVIPLLKAKGIDTIDILVITHDDYDHNGGLESLQEEIAIKEIITEAKDIDLTWLHFFAWQDESADAEDENAQSIVLYSEINGLKYLFTGDLPIAGELALIDAFANLDVDVLKVGHHGSKTSSAQAFIEQITPSISIIMSGKNNLYGHPHEEVLEILENAGSYILNTQDDGSISIFFHVGFNVLLTGNHLISFLDSS